MYTVSSLRQQSPRINIGTFKTKKGSKDISIEVQRLEKRNSTKTIKSTSGIKNIIKISHNKAKVN